MLPFAAIAVGCIAESEPIATAPPTAPGAAEGGSTVAAGEGTPAEMSMPEKFQGLEFTETDSGLKYHVLAPGEGEKPGPTDTVEVHYDGMFADGEKFDSSRDRGETISFPLNGVIGGWTEGMQLVAPGGRILLVCPPDLAYGPAGRPGIPPNSTLYFDVELFKVN